MYMSRNYYLSTHFSHRIIVGSKGMQYSSISFVYVIGAAIKIFGKIEKPYPYRVCTVYILYHAHAIYVSCDDAAASPLINR